MKLCAGLASGKLFTTAVKSSLHLASRLSAYINQRKLLQSHLNQSQRSRSYHTPRINLPFGLTFIQLQVCPPKPRLKNASLIFNQEEGVQEK